MLLERVMKVLQVHSLHPLVLWPTLLIHRCHKECVWTLHYDKNRKNECQYLLRPKYHVTCYIIQDYLIQWCLKGGGFISGALNQRCISTEKHHSWWAQQSFKYAGHCHVLDGSSCYCIITLPNTPCTHTWSTSYLRTASLRAE